MVMIQKIEVIKATLNTSIFLTHSLLLYKSPAVELATGVQKAKLQK